MRKTIKAKIRPDNSVKIMSDIQASKFLKLIEIMQGESTDRELAKAIKVSAYTIEKAKNGFISNNTGRAILAAFNNGIRL